MIPLSSRHLPGLRAAIAVTLALGFHSALASEAQLADLSLEELLTIEVTTVSRKAQKLTDTAAAAYVITAEELQRSGVTSVPEALRMVPGIEVARLNAGRWAVSARGFNGRFANKLLVLMDGRSIYSPLFSGVFWEAEDVMLEDVDRIEVIRGPGAAMWGANAVNGVINIITKSAAATQGGLATAQLGNEDKGGAALRYGGRSGDDTYYRVWAKWLSRDDSRLADSQAANDHWRGGHAGLRLDKATGSDGDFTVIGNAYKTKSGDDWLVPTLSAPYFVSSPLDQRNSGANLLGRYQWDLADDSQASLQAYADYSELAVGDLITERRTTFDIDFQHRLHLGSIHDLIWGGGYRYSRDHIETDGRYFTVRPDRDSMQLFSAFLHDEITLLPDRWKLMLGAKLEHNSMTGFEVQPNVRLLWTPTSTDTMWAAVSRGVRTPSRGERDAEVNLQVIPPIPPSSPLPVLVRAQPNPAFGSEKLTAYELGYRTQITTRLSLDTAAFYNHYTDLRSSDTIGNQLAFDLVAGPYIINQGLTSNSLDANSRGLEVALDWHPATWWRLQGAYTYLRVSGKRNGDVRNDQTAAFFEGSVPRHQFSLRSSWTVTPNHLVDLWVKHVDTLPASGIPAYTSVDMRYAWKVSKALELSLVGQNLFDPHHPEFVSDFLTTRSVEIDRGYFVKARIEF